MHDNEAKGREVIAELAVAASLPAKLSCRTLEETELEACRNGANGSCASGLSVPCVTRAQARRWRGQWSRQALIPHAPYSGSCGFSIV